MILFIAPNPFKVAQREGFLQRVVAIDELFPDEEKCYSEDLSPTDLAATLLKADTIYVHSMYNATKILPCYKLFADKIITDLHGVVPEEETVADNIEMARVMAATEHTVFRYGKSFVAVTDAMVEHFTQKYTLTDEVSFVTLPIFADVAVDTGPAADPHSVIYAGGAQPWQNTDMMVNAINAASSDYNFTILTHSPEAFESVKPEVSGRVNIKAVDSNQIGQYYRQAAYGFVLRDDTIVNRVACPTKLIEYLAYGIIPIVLSPNIGDFQKMGYAYVTLEAFQSGSIDANAVTEASSRNKAVYETFRQKTSEGKQALKDSVSPKIVSGTETKPTLSTELIEALLESQHLSNEILKKDYQIEVYRQKVGEYADALQDALNRIPGDMSLVKRVERLNGRVRRHLPKGFKTH